MEPATWGFLGAIIGAIVGAAASIVTTIINSRKEVKIQKDLDLFKREEISREFQRNNLLKLQDVIHDYMRNIAKANIEDSRHFKNEGAWQKNMLGEPLNEDIRLNTREIMILEERIINDKLRDDINKFRMLGGSYFLSQTETEGLRIMSDLGNEFPILNSCIGRNFRKLQTIGSGSN